MASIDTQANTAPEYIKIVTRNSKLTVPTNILQRSAVIKKWLENWNKSDEFYINRKDEDVNNLINFMSGYSYDNNDSLWELVDEFIVDNKVMEEKVEKAKYMAIINRKLTNWLINYEIKLDIPYLYVKKIAADIKKDYNNCDCAIIRKRENYVIRIYKVISDQALSELNNRLHSKNKLLNNGAGIEFSKEEADKDVVEYYASNIKINSKYIFEYHEDNWTDAHCLRWSNTEPEAMRDNMKNIIFYKKP